MTHTNTTSTFEDAVRLMDSLICHSVFVGYMAKRYPGWLNCPGFLNRNFIGEGNSKRELRDLNQLLGFKSQDSDNIAICALIYLFYNFFDDARNNSGSVSAEHAFEAGVAAGVLRSLTPNSGMLTQLAAAVGSVAVRNRHRKAKSEKSRLVSIADARWNEGSKLLHNEMADELLNQQRELNPKVSKAMLLAALRPIAAKYGKVRGLKGIRKEKLPPK